MRFTHIFLLLGILVHPVQAFADPNQDKYLDQIELAIAGGRFAQADQMLDRVDVQPENQFRLSLIKADLLLAREENAEAFSLYVVLAGQQSANVQAATGAGLAALRLHRNGEAHQWLLLATSLEGADWRAWNGLGVSSDFQENWKLSENAYKRAIATAPASAMIWNNLGYSFLCQRRFDEAIKALEQAIMLAPDVSKIQANLDVAYALVGHYPQSKRAGEPAGQWARRLNNAGYAALIAGDRTSARSLFSRAIEASDIRFPKAEANLRLMESAR
jgi:Flp pilus assembly protein TadD